MIAATIEDLRVSYAGETALDGVSLEIRPGETLVVLGPSGSGKTALARVIVGIDRAESGEIRFDGRSVLGLAPQDRKVGYLPSDGGLWPHRSVADNVGYALRVKKVARRERRERIGEAMSAARLDGLGERPIDSLSPLQARRVALARALLAEPDLMVVDEPTAGLDPRSRGEFRDDLRRVQEESKATGLVLTADPREALQGGDRLAVMDFGKIVHQGTPGEVYNRPIDAFVARMLGPVNLIQGQAESAGSRGEVVVRTPLGRLIGRPSSDEPPAPGSPVTVAIRPEALGLGPTVPAGANRFAATVEKTILLGATRQLTLRGPGDWPISALALQATSDGLREGQGLTVSVAPEFVVILPSRAGTGEDP